MKIAQFLSGRSAAFLFVVCAMGLLLSSIAGAHQSSEAYLAFEKNQTIELSLAIRDLDLALPSLDADEDRKITRDELVKSLPQIKQYLTQELAIQCDSKPANLAWELTDIVMRGDHMHALFSSALRCASDQSLNLNYGLISRQDASHRVLLSGSVHGQSLNQVITPAVSRVLTLYSAQEKNSLPQLVGGYVLQGMHHLSMGWDHLAFLLALMLPLPFLRTAPLMQSMKPALWRVSCFTVGHCVSLVACVLGYIQSPAWAEPVIALSIGLAVWAQFATGPARQAKQFGELLARMLALGFGVVHGLGFSSALVQANISSSVLPWALLGFNLGIELAQITFVFLWCLFIRYLPRQERWHPNLVTVGSVALVMGSFFWFYQALPS
jgi:HupE / UreJ protein